MKATFLILSMFIAIGLQGQTPGDATLPPPPQPGTTQNAQIFTIVDQMPEFPGGEAEMFKFLAKNVRYPANARDCGCQGTVFATFVVADDGSVQDARILRGVNCGTGIKYYDKKGKELPESKKDQAVSILDYDAVEKELADETLRVINLMPKWTPGEKNAQSVKVQYQLPLKFTLR